jgi:hypothetical protein
MKVRSNINAGGSQLNHNEKSMIDEKGSIESGKSFIKKLSLKKETIRELKATDLRRIAGGRMSPADTNSDKCDTSDRCTDCC